MNKPNYLILNSLRITIFLLVISSFAFLQDFIDHARAFFMGFVYGQTITQAWLTVLIHILIFLAFLIPLSFRRKIDWKEYGLVTTFFVSLFVEMYGLPFSLIFISRMIGDHTHIELRRVISINILGVTFAATIPILYGTTFIIIGCILILIAFITLYKNMREEGLVTTGVYAISRHPQYLGFILIIVGWFIEWPTFINLILSTILVYKYIHLCMLEEKELKEMYDYVDYKKNVPMLI